jgi:hypothetical protein
MNKTLTVLSAYSVWMVNQREEGWNVVDLHSDVVDLHSEMRAKVDQARASQPGFTVQKDGVHPDSAGHWTMAQSLIAFFGDPDSAKLKSADELLDSERLAVISQRMKIYQKAIHAETKPLRPGVPQGGTLESAATESKALEERIYAHVQTK